MAEPAGSQDQSSSLEIENRVDDAFAEIANTLPTRDKNTFTGRELRVLELWDRLEDLRLERTLVETQIELSRAPPSASLSQQDSHLQLEDAERRLLDARAMYLLRNSIVDNVVQADPLLKAIHSGQRASPVERALHPLIDQRDVLSLVQTNLSARLQTTLNSITTARTENLRAIKKNQDLTAAVLNLADRTKPQNIESVDDPSLKEQLESLQRETKDSKRKYRIIKSLVGTVVASSGVDWSSSEELCQLVLDAEE